MSEQTASTKNVPEKVLVFDIGHTWTKAFFLEFSNTTFQVVAKSYLPTTSSDLSLTITQSLLDLTKLSKTKLWQGEHLSFPLIVTTELKLPEAVSQLAEKVVETKEARESLVKIYQKGQGKIDFKVVDLGSVIFNTTETEEINSSLVFPMNAVDIENYLGNRRLHPSSLPLGRREIELEQATAKVAWKKLFPFPKPPTTLGHDLLLTGAVFAFSPEDTLTALMVLDNLPEFSIARVWVDIHLIAPSLGALTVAYPKIADLFGQEGFQKKLFELAAFKNLGTFISLGRAGTVKVDFGYAQLQEVVIDEDQLVLLPVKIDQGVSFRIPMKGKKIQVSLEGGELGVVFDGRPKPLRLTSGKVSQERILRWRESLKKVESI